MRFKFPNYLTIGRIIIVPLFVFTFYLPGFYGDILPFTLFVIASFTDFLDGLLARMFKEESRLGELLDPIAGLEQYIVAKTDCGECYEPKICSFDESPTQTSSFSTPS